MERKNATQLTEFVLTGLTYQPEWQIPLFVLFLVIYIFTIMGNLGLIAVIWNDPHLHTPMYLFLGSLACVDTWLSSTVVPKMLVNIFTKNKRIFLSECIVQFFSFGVSGTTECFLLATMSYDRYVAICNPLLYPAIMTNRLCMRMLISSLTGGLLHTLLHACFLFRLTFCNSNIIHQFYCDIMPLFKISCTDPSVNVLMIFIFSGSIQVFTILIILVSYTSSLYDFKEEVCTRHKESVLHLWCPPPICLLILWESFHVCAPWIHTSRWSRYDGLSILHCHNSFLKSNYLQPEK